MEELSANLGGTTRQRAIQTLWVLFQMTQVPGSDPGANIRIKD
jgi:hypothetical protein